MKTLKLTKKLLLGTAGAAALVIPLVGGIALNRVAIAQVDGEYLPIVKVAPIYPAEAVARGLEGSVIVEYTVAADGSTKDVKVRESSSTLFNESAIESAQKYKYKPRVVDGTPRDVPGVTTRIVYELESNEPVSTGTATEGSDQVRRHERRRRMDEIKVSTR